jgi:NAD(P)-dependent dehydrogenase (short-subunit alcohol dehydrogenase family)
VTGGGDGLGRAFALALAKAGARVAVTRRRAEPLAETAELVERGRGRALAFPGDVSAPDAVTRVVSTAESQLGPIDILVNNAGVVGPLGYDWQADPEAWWRTFEVNVLGSFRCAREVLAGMVARRRGRIVNVSSGAAFNRLPRILRQDLRPVRHRCFGSAVGAHSQRHTGFGCLPSTLVSCARRCWQA